MNLRKILLVLAALGTTAAVLLYSILQRSAGPEDAQSAAQKNAANGRVSAAIPQSRGTTAEQASAGGIVSGKAGSVAGEATPAMAVSAPQTPAVTPTIERVDGGRMPLHESVAAPASGVFVSASGKETAMEPNEIGVFERQLIQPSEAVKVRVSYPTGSPGDLVVAAVEDGGLLENGKHTAALRLDAERTAAFRFEATEAQGLFRVTLQKGVDVKIVEMWAGPEPKLAGQN